jgi:hypothetical protein
MKREVAMIKYEYEIIKTNKNVDRYIVTSTDKLSIDELEEYVREKCLFVGQSKKIKLDNLETETTYIGRDAILSEESFDVVNGHGDINHED